MKIKSVADITLIKLRNQYSQYCIDKLNSIKRSRNYPTSNTLRADLITYSKELIANNRNSLSEDDYKKLQSFCDKYGTNFVDSYEKILLEYKIQTTEEQNGIEIDRDPVVKNRHTYIKGKRLKVFSDYHGTNATYSMADMVANINIKTDKGTISTALGELQTISYSIFQNKAPVRVLGNMNPKDWVFGPRTIAGSLVFAVFNKHWLMDLYDNLKEKAGMKNWHFISDEIPAFDITLTFANEYGFDSRMALYGVRLMNEGQTMSTNDIFIENTYQFVANDIELMDSLTAFQTEESRHQRGQIVDNTAKDTTKETEKKVIPIDENKNKINSAPTDYKSRYDRKQMIIPDDKLSTINQKTALQYLDETYKAWIEVAKDDQEFKNRIKEDYKTEKIRIKAYYSGNKEDKK